MYKIVIRDGQIILVARSAKTIVGKKTTILIPRYYKRKSDVIMAQYSTLKRAASEYLEAYMDKERVLAWAKSQS